MVSGQEPVGTFQPRLYIAGMRANDRFDASELSDLMNLKRSLRDEAEKWSRHKMTCGDTGD
jgi:hypothetical protein